MALTKDRNTTYREGIEIEVPVAASTKIYAGSLVAVNSAGYAVPGADTAGLRFMGVAMQNVDNSAGSNGDKNVVVRRAGVFDFNGNTLTQASVGTVMYLYDDETIAPASVTTNDIPCGRLVQYISATRGVVDIGQAWVS